ncbi:MAG: hypothetical protein QOH21_2283 [Acidobacteriota bacterium]|jgi:hypothetical protein|nr:hypothetical protein [Acidobacteriota bacterium]
MIKKLVVFLGLLVLPVLASAQMDRDLLLTPDGTMFTVEREWSDSSAAVEPAAMSYLVLTTRRGESIERQIIPATRTSGAHINPALAYDSESQMLFVLWERSLSLTHRELLFCTLGRDGNWSEPVTFAGDSNAYRTNLRIAVTRKVDLVPVDDDPSVVPGISVHAVWWEQDRYHGEESAQYALFSVYNGEVTGIETRRLTNLLTNLEKRDPQPQPDGFDPEVLRHPALFSLPTSDAVDVVFGDEGTGGFHRLRIRPGKRYSDARVHIPLGKGESNFPSPGFAHANSEARVGAINGDPDRLAFFVRDGNQTVRYVTYKDAHWSGVQSILLDEQVSAEAAIDAIRRLLNDE